MKCSTLRGYLAPGTLALLMIGCGGDERNAPSPDGSRTGEEVPRVSADAPVGSAGGVYAIPSDSAASEGVVLFVGTSLTAGLGLQPSQAFPALIGELILEEGLPFRVVNAGVSGETSAGALGRVNWLLQQSFDVLVLETGANDMLRGVDPAATEANIRSIITRVRERQPDAVVVLVGMRAAPNLGRSYVERFESMYPRIAADYDLELVPFLLEGVAAVRELNQSDGIHPNAEGQRRAAETVWRVLGPALENVAVERLSSR